MPFLQLASRKIHYTDLQPPKAHQDPPVHDPDETLVFTHGLGSSQNFYHAVAVGLQAQGIRCILFDTSGAGRSPYTQVAGQGEQSVESLASDVLGVLDALGVQRAGVVGHSMGGIVASQLAAQYPSRILAAILIGPVYPSPSVIPVFESRIQAIEKNGMEAVANSVPQTATGARASPLTRSFIRELILAQDPAGYISHCRVIINAQPPDYAAIRVPVLVLAGEEDRSAPLEACRRMFEELGTSGDRKRLEVLEGVGHWHCLEDGGGGVRDVDGR
ncbi:Alpha/Beta hydrolase protein [Dendryphion nanum]|uniref:Alpha/Beta hydrolase protein n=1 Tax=Dendryphion nanum TaxID=256645 RepID=A0A9P9D9S1_9PLEO|nr:Alpha/Beta hydrolase protein [Dendryphion nanum]